MKQILEQQWRDKEKRRGLLELVTFPQAEGYREGEGEEISGSGHSRSKLMRAQDSCVGMASSLGGPMGKDEGGGQGLEQRLGGGEWSKDLARQSVALHQFWFEWHAFLWEMPIGHERVGRLRIGH